MISIGNRIRQYRKAEGLTVRAFAKLVGISQGSLSDIENGKWVPSGAVIASLVQKTDINPMWLLTGQGAMYRPARDEEHILLRKDRDFIEWAIVKLLREMDEENRREILKHIEEKKLLKELLAERQRLKEDGQL
ncbi:MAG: helix-turn-helix domain-containing protein [Thermodesulfovibrionales bacterium]